MKRSVEVDVDPMLEEAVVKSAAKKQRTEQIVALKNQQREIDDQLRALEAENKKEEEREQERLMEDMKELLRTRKTVHAVQVWYHELWQDKGVFLSKEDLVKSLDPSPMRIRTAFLYGAPFLEKDSD